MPQPSSSTTLQRADLGMVAYEYMLEAADRGFIGSSIFPIFDVNEQSADYPVIPIEAILKLKDTTRSVGGNYNRDDYDFETGTYACFEYGWEERVGDDERNLYARFYDLDEVAVKRAIDVLMRQHEYRVSSAVFNTSNVTNTAAVTTEWSTAASATPYNDVIGGKEALYAATGVMANRMAISWKVFMNILKTAELKDAFKYTSPSEIKNDAVKRQMLADYFGVEQLYVGNAIKDGVKKGQTYSLEYMWDDEYCLLFKGSDSMNLKDPQLGRTFLYTKDTPDIITTEQYREEQTRADIFRVRHYTDEAFIFTGAGYLLSNITA